MQIQCAMEFFLRCLSAFHLQLGMAVPSFGDSSRNWNAVTAKRQYASLIVGDCSKDCKGCKKTPFNEEDSALFDVKDSSEP